MPETKNLELKGRSDSTFAIIRTRTITKIFVVTHSMLLLIFVNQNDAIRAMLERTHSIHCISVDCCNVDLRIDIIIAQTETAILSTTIETN